MKRPDVLPKLFFRLLGCSGYRQIARDLQVSHTTVMRQTERLGRHCLLFHEQFRSRTQLGEPLVVDGFESFEHSQYHPFHFHLAVGAGSHFLYAFTDSPLRRKGRMTPYQKRRRAELEKRFGRPDPRSVEKEVHELLQLVPIGSRLQLVSDDHRDYPRAVQRLGKPVEHRVVSSKRPRTPGNPLFPVNLMDNLIRHSSSNHKRETIAFSKRRQNAAEKLWIFLVWRNYVKSWSEKRRSPSPAERLGLVQRKLSVQEILATRLFPGRIRLPERLEIYYRRRTRTLPIPEGREHRLDYAF